MLKTVLRSHPPTRARRDALVTMSKAAASAGTKRQPFSPARPELPEQLFAGDCTLSFLSDARTKLTGVFSILLEHAFDGTASRRVQFPGNAAGFVSQPAGMHGVFHGLCHRDGILCTCNGRIHEYGIGSVLHRQRRI